MNQSVEHDLNFSCVAFLCNRIHIVIARHPKQSVNMKSSIHNIQSEDCFVLRNDDQSSERANE